MCKNLWPTIEANQEETPKNILKQQADYLSQNTKGRIVGEIEITNGATYEMPTNLRTPQRRGELELCVRLVVTVPSMGYVRYLLVSMLQNPVQTYPCLLKDELNETEYTITDLGTFIGRLKEILQSEKMKTLLSTIMPNE